MLPTAQICLCVHGLQQRAWPFVHFRCGGSAQTVSTPLELHVWRFEPGPVPRNYALIKLSPSSASLRGAPIVAAVPLGDGRRESLLGPHRSSAL